jgi:hypothetical protein
MYKQIAANVVKVIEILLGRCEHCQMKIVCGWLSAVNDLLYRLGKEDCGLRIADSGLRIEEKLRRQETEGSA